MFGTVQISCDAARHFIVEQDSSLLVYHTPSSTITARTEPAERKGTVGNQATFAGGTTPRSLIQT